MESNRRGGAKWNRPDSAANWHQTEQVVPIGCNQKRWCQMEPTKPAMSNRINPNRRCQMGSTRKWCRLELKRKEAGRRYGAIQSLSHPIQLQPFDPPHIAVASATPVIAPLPYCSCAPPVMAPLPYCSCAPSCCRCLSRDVRCPRFPCRPG